MGIVTPLGVEPEDRRYYPHCRIFRVKSGRGSGDLQSNLCGVVIFADPELEWALGRSWSQVKEDLERAGGAWEDLGPDGPAYWNCRAG